MMAVEAGLQTGAGGATLASLVRLRRARMWLPAAQLMAYHERSVEERTLQKALARQDVHIGGQQVAIGER